MDIKDNKKSETKQTLFLVLGIFLVSMFIIGGTYAYMTLSIDINNNTIAYNTACFDIVYDADNDSTPITGTLIPSSGPGGGLNGKISMGLSANCINIDAYGTFNLDVTSGSDILFQTVDAHCENSQTLRTLTKYTDSVSCGASASGKWVTSGTALKYAIYTTNDITSTTVPVKTGYIKRNGLIPIYENFPVLNETVDYYFYIWLDGNLTDNTYASQSFTGGVSATVTQVAAVSPNPNAPVLDSGMIPVTIANDGTVTTVSSSDSSWYNYDNKEWANVVLVKESGTQTRDYYKTNTGVTVAEADILAYYVWIPRYKYRIQVSCSALEGCHSYILSDEDKELFINYWYENLSSISSNYIDYTLEEATEDVETLLSTGKVYMEQEDYTYSFEQVLDWYNYDIDPDITYTEKSIDIVFESKNSEISLGDAVNTYYTHPAFIWDGNTISGIWVGKFNTTGNETTPTILPNVDMLKVYVSSHFVTSLKFAGGTLSGSSVTFNGSDSYGLTSLTDSHMMKNRDWGAVTYLSHSKYGINMEIGMNNYYSDDGSLSGCGVLDSSYSEYECQFAYGSGITEYLQSTTGNISGIFDMHMGAYRIVVMGNYGNTIGGSGFTTLPDSKYYDLYSSSQFLGNMDNNIDFCTLESCGGHALHETFGWYNSEGDFVFSERPWFERGGYIEGVDLREFGTLSIVGNGGSLSRSVLVVD